ncbi:hypothetical protein [Thermomonas haemolytica]|uniref:Bacteriophage Rz lysis protein n=1 Tax=Thermomonas haemolytica TaxID=141949 RepID=A0A4R3N954_9GAMM|nr:hypothetical protein [Thermomonas haemolytica]TCT25918.1 hypothetical protein EDC34_101244 [Thermomonas haemolytica]
MSLPRLLPAWPLATYAGIAVLAAGIGGGLLGWTVRGWRDVGQIAGLRAQLARTQADAERARAEAIARARAADAAAITDLQQRLTRAAATTEDLRYALATATTGRVCLSADARRVLHRAPAFAAVPAPAAGPAAAGPAAAADPGERASTDADIAGWALDAAALYEQCRARIDAIRRWDEVTHGR